MHRRPNAAGVSPQAAVLLWSIALACLAPACGSSSISVSSPTGVKCSVALTNSMTSVPAAGATGTLTIQTNRDCTWSASTSTPWISLMSSGNGQGEASLSYRVDANSDPSPRHGIVNVTDSTGGITQEAAPCRFSVAPAVASIPAAGGSIDAGVTASSTACAWTASTTAPWIKIAAGANGSGSGTVTLSVLPNGGEAREGRVTIAGQTLTVSQPALGAEVPAPAPAPAPNPNPSPAPGPTPCAFTLEPATQTIAAAGGSGSIAVTVGSGCTWSATTSAPWITITAGSNLQGNGTVSFVAAANSGAARSATIQVGTSTATINQPAVSCSYTLAPASQSLGAEGGSGTITVTTGSGCAWTATKDASWISITSGGSGTGQGTVSFSVSANSGASRSGTINIAGRTFTVTQAGAGSCSYSISPTSQSVPASGGTGTVTITAANGCGWTGTSNANWLTITSATSGSGSGSITFSAGGNTGTARSGTLTIAGQTFTVPQEASTCSFP